MAFSAQAICGSSTLSLTDGNPFRIRNAESLSGSPNRHVTLQGPSQLGDTHIDYRLQPRTFKLKLGFRATTDSALDTYRSTLIAFFKPQTATPVNIKITRDDGGIRQVDCNAIERINIRLVKEHRLSHYHEATITLRAPFPGYYDPTPGTVTVTGSPGTAADWYLAGGAIGTAQVLMSGGSPSQGATWSYAGSIAHTTSWTLAMRADKEALGTVDHYMFVVNNANTGEIPITLRAGTPDYYASDTILGDLGTAFMPTGISNYFIRHDTSGLDFGDALPTAYQDAYNSNYPGFSGKSRPIGGATRRWRSDASNTAASRWGGTIHLYALYSPGLTWGQVNALDTYMAGGIGGTTNTFLSTPYSGDLDEYPVITITGPIGGITLQNVATSQSLYFSTVTVGAGTTMVIDTRPGYKSVLLGTAYITPDPASALGSWRIAADASGGINGIRLYGTATGTATAMKVVYYNRYSSW